EFETALVDAELFRERLRVRDAANVVRAERRGHDRFVLEQNAGDHLEIQIALRFLQENGAGPAVLTRFYFFEVPIRSFNEPNGKPRPAFASPFKQVSQIILRITQVRLNHDPDLRPISKLTFHEKRFEKLERRIFVRVALHIEIHKRAKIARATQDRSQFRRKMRDRVRRIGRIHLGIERGNLYGEIHDREQIGVFPERIRPTATFASEMLEQFQTAHGVFVRLVFANDRFAQKVDRESDALLALFAQRFHHVLGISSGDKLARHAGNVPAQKLAADEGNDPRRADTGANQRRVAVAHVGKIFVEMLDDVGSAMKGRENIHETKELNFEMLVAHRERHHSLIKAGFAEERLRVLIDEFKNAFAPPVDLGLQSAHMQK